MTTPTAQTNDANLIAAVSYGLLTGGLSLSTGSLSAAIARCEQYVTAMNQLRKRFASTPEEHGFGRLPSGEAVGRHFIDKQLEMASVLTQYIAVAERMREVFLDAAERYAAVEDANAGMLGALDNPR